MTDLHKTNCIDVDLNSYIIYEYNPCRKLMAFEFKNAIRFDQLIRKYDGIENIPDDETIEGISLEYNHNKNAYDIQSTVTENVRINDLSSAFIEHIKP